MRFLRIHPVHSVINNITQLSGIGFLCIFYMKLCLSQLYVCLVLQNGSRAVTFENLKFWNVCVFDILTIWNFEIVKCWHRCLYVCVFYIVFFLMFECLIILEYQTNVKLRQNKSVWTIQGNPLPESCAMLFTTLCTGWNLKKRTRKCIFVQTK